MMDKTIKKLLLKSDLFLQKHFVGHADSGSDFLDGSFALRLDQPKPDLYGMVDAVYIYHVLGQLSQKTNRISRQIWAERILKCQDDQGWFSRRNLRGHTNEHATAYAIGALRLLEIDAGEHYVDRMKPLKEILSLLKDENEFLRWISTLNFRLSTREILNKRLGWHHIWSGSHIGGGVPAAIAMADDLIDKWWPGQADLEGWYKSYFAWLDAHANSKTGYWQRAFWNLVYRKPTLIDMGGAVHFFWVYESKGRPFPYPEATLRATLTLQRSSGLYKDHPFCIDLDGNFCLIRSYLQLSEDRKQIYRDQVYLSAERSFEAIVKMLTEVSLTEIYNDSHGLPGALAALVECTKLPGFKYAASLRSWQHPLDRVMWL